ncbi:hypothetical protein [Gimesia sp.]|uniref:hypothetical protein n=1 Tax=Gimesia sp. TaxID=2024833 RepID=UPI0032EF0882
MSGNHFENSDSAFAPLPRPQFQLRSLPPGMRWEVTRRHPIYQNFWNDASLTQITDPQELSLRQLVNEGRLAMLAMIGFSGDPISPETEFTELDSETLPSWMSGAIQPISFRGLTGLLLAYLPEDVIQQIAELFQSDSGAEEDHRIESLLRLHEIPAPFLDQYPDELILSVSPTASVRNLTDDMSAVLESFRRERNISARRNREDLYSSYLQVWDLREGWESGTYVSGRERRLTDIAAELQESLTTIHNWYKRAFELITGHRYSPEHWFRVFGPLKFIDFEGVLELGEILLRRPRRSPTPRAITDTASSSEERDGILSQQSTEDDFEVLDMRMDLRELLAMDLTDEELAERFGADKINLIREYRRRFGDRPGS